MTTIKYNCVYCVGCGMWGGWNNIFSVATATQEVQMSVCLSVCQSPKPPNSIKSIISPYHNLHHHSHHTHSNTHTTTHNITHTTMHIIHTQHHTHHPQSVHQLGEYLTDATHTKIELQMNESIVQQFIEFFFHNITVVDFQHQHSCKLIFKYQISVLITFTIFSNINPGHSILAW